MKSKSCPPARMKTLVVEDDRDLLELITRILEQRGHAVDAATDGETAVRLACANRYDLIILDLILPDSDGVILHGRLKKVAPNLEGKTIFMTGFTSQQPVIDYLRSLSAVFLHKPFGPEDLVRAVEKVSLPR